MVTISGDKFFGGKPGRVVQPANDVPITTDTPTEAPVEKKSFLQGVKDSFNERVDSARASQEASATRKQSIASGALQTLGQGAGFVGDISLEGLKAITPEKIEKPVTEFVQKGVEKVASTDAGQSVIEWAKAHPEAAKNLQSIVDIASIIPAAKGVSGVVDTAGKVLSGGVNVAEGGATLASRMTQKAGETLYKTAIDPNIKEAEKIIKFNADNPFGTRLKAVITGEKLSGKPITRSDTAFEYGLKGTEEGIGTQARRYAHDLWSKSIQPALDNSSEVVTKDELFKPIIERIQKTVEPGKKKAYTEAFAAVQEDYADFLNAPLSVAQKIKSQLDEFTPDKLFRGQSISNEYNVLKNDMANSIRQKIYDSLKDVNIKKQYRDYANLNELEKIGVRAITDGKLKGGFGGFVSGLWDMASIPVKTIGGRTLYRVGKTIEYASDKSFKTFGEYLKSKGYKVSPEGLLILTPLAGKVEKED